MKKNNPLISVVMAAYNEELYIARALDSLLCQDFKDFEIIVVNDCSQDRTVEIVKIYMKKDQRIRLFHNKKNMKIAASLNKGIRHARANIIARMDADDVSHPDRLSKQFNFIQKHPRVAAVGADIAIATAEGKIVSQREYPASSKDLKRVMFRYSPFAHPVVMYRKHVFEEFGGYDLAMVPCEDIDLWFKMGSKYEFASLPEKLLTYSIIQTSASHRSLKDVELLGFTIKLQAILQYGYRPSPYDAIFNFLQFVTLWFMPDMFRIHVYEFLRSKKLI